MDYHDFYNGNKKNFLGGLPGSFLKPSFLEAKNHGNPWSQKTVYYSFRKINMVIKIKKSQKIFFLNNYNIFMVIEW